VTSQAGNKQKPNLNNDIILHALSKIEQLDLRICHNEHTMKLDREKVSELA
jgi:hypothetical protein